MELSKERIESLRELLAPANRKIVIVAHTNPDGDAVGSSLAWAEVLRGMGHTVTCIVPNKYPYFLDWMPGIGQVVVFKNDTADGCRDARPFAADSPRAARGRVGDARSHQDGTRQGRDPHPGAERGDAPRLDRGDQGVRAQQ